ncbi:Chemotaxis response regulator protein-glutamate methylesterase [bioreactor metagenome]|uniref:Chemotaxis response regulator protein-glutamate methylesterase n=1 Tax=bioreactor metagenome TaxID=1076179 RepID=A0A644VSK4_9ZZZZ
MRAVIVDDEYYAMQGLKMELEDIGGIEIAGIFEDCSKLLAQIKEIQPDIIFLDIEMPQMTGFQLVDKLMDSGCAPKIVFVTAFSHYAVTAFEINAIDYIVKPVTKNRLIKTLEKIGSFPATDKEAALQINCFRHFSIQVNGKDINSGWRTRKAEELIAFLISEKGSYVSKDKIAEALWPEQSRESAMSNLYLAYYYIKKQEEKYGVRIPVESERGKMRINMELIVCDMLEFDKLIESANNASAGQRAVTLEKAAELYRGLLFEDSYYTWVVTIQSNYEYRYIELLNYLIDYHLENGEKQKAVYYEEKMNQL